MARLYQKFESPDDAEQMIRRYIEFTDDVEGKRTAWHTLTRLYAVHSRHKDELMAHIQMAQLPGSEYELISNAANRFNGIIRQPEFDLDDEEKKQIVELLARLMEGRIQEADATDCSRLGWLFYASWSTR